jgi:hypothetical protein|tara:strand:- start:1020 stop:1247 length:228 start_codon:yes stop_codon:yes gene_type:complete
MKINGGISVGNIITIGMLAITVALAWGAMDSRLLLVQDELGKKADKELINVKLKYIQRDVAEIKQMLKDKTYAKK